MGAIVIRTRFDEGTESAEVATSGEIGLFQCFMHQIYTWTFVRQIKTLVALYKLKPLQNLT